MDNAPFTIIESKKGYSIVWVISKSDSDICKFHKLPGDISLPYFVAGEDLTKMENGEGIELSEVQLSMGLLLRYNATPPMTATHEIKPYFAPVLRDLLINLIQRLEKNEN
jgi:hypothetical protein